MYQLAYYSTILFFRCITSLASYDLKSTEKINKGILFSGKDAESSSTLTVRETRLLSVSPDCQKNDMAHVSLFFAKQALLRR